MVTVSFLKMYNKNIANMAAIWHQSKYHIWGKETNMTFLLFIFMKLSQKFFILFYFLLFQEMTIKTCSQSQFQRVSQPTWNSLGLTIF